MPQRSSLVSFGQTIRIPLEETVFNMATKSFFLALLVMGITAFAACGDDDDDAVLTTATSTATRQPEATAAPRATPTPSGTGVKIVDDVIAAVNAKDAAKLTALLHFWLRACTEPQGIGALPCPTGSPIGTPVMVVHFGACEGSFFKPGDPAITTGAQGFVDRATKLYAVVKARPFDADTSVPGKYQVVFEPGVSISVADEGITSFSFNCGGGNAAEYIASGRYGTNPEYLVKPK